MYLVILDEGHRKQPLDLCDKLWKAEERKKEYILGWKTINPKIDIFEIEILKDSKGV